MTPHPQNLRREVQVHKARMDEVLERACGLATIQSPEVAPVRALLEKLLQLWAALQEEAERRQQRLDTTYQVEQYSFDVAEVEAWLSEQELFVMNEETGKVGNPERHPGLWARRGRRRGRAVPGLNSSCVLSTGCK